MTALWFALSNWKLILGGLTVAVLGAYVGYLNLVNAHLETKLARIEADYATCQTVNAGNVTELAQIRLDAGRAIAAIQADRDRIAAQKEKVRVVKERINAQADICPAVPGAVVEWLNFMRGSAGGEDRAGATTGPGKPTDLLRSAPGAR